ncbi:AraC family transcriptional regulator [Paenibacillus psychroresistens]|uniref:AraC family transcriptional regulator n=1 Tax=Paenibacillus psychroresistens TaxID=1778678 RepID=A0A6B8RI40_9BACL|nr:AraC family transcriptional regulator [Paenibacillus psychroresistens]QGQ95910.1 AraC family transcriptional regulator [Paenibacillus psychroresistens]
MIIVKQNSQFPAADRISILSPVTITVLCENICQHLWSENRLQRFRGQIYFQELLYVLLQDALHLQVSDSDESLEYVKYYIEKNYQQELTIEQLAKVARISSRHFMRLFKKRYGCSAIEYLTIHRIKQAQQLIRAGSQYQLKDIARYVGYNDDFYFRHKFKQISGIPPAAFKRNSKQKIAAYHSLSIGVLLALQIIPFAAPANHPWTHYYNRKFETDNVLPLSLAESLKWEELQLASPDFIIGFDNLASIGERERLSDIAPVFLVPWVDTDWRMQLNLLSQFLGRKEVGEVWLERYERKAGF